MDGSWSGPRRPRPELGECRFLAAAPDATFTLARQHWATEQQIRKAGVRFTVPAVEPVRGLRSVTGSDGVIRGPAGTGRVAWVGRDDIADVAVAVLLSDAHDGQSYDMTGPEALSMAGTAETLGRVTGRPIAYHEETIEEAWASRRPTGAPDWEMSHRAASGPEGGIREKAPAGLGR